MRADRNYPEVTEFIDLHLKTCITVVKSRALYIMLHISLRLSFLGIYRHTEI